MVSTLAGGGGGTLLGYVDGVGTVARFNGPYGIASLSSGDVMVADTYNNNIRKITSSGVHEQTQHIFTLLTYTLWFTSRHLSLSWFFVSFCHHFLLFCSFLFSVTFLFCV